MIVNETFVKRFWSGMDPIGKRVTQGRRSWEVIGVARDSKYVTLGESPRPFVYMPYNPVAQGFVLQIRTTGDPMRVLPSVRRIVGNLDANLPITDIRTMQDLMGFSLFPSRVAATALGLFSGIALLLASIGTYGVMAYLTSRRVREIGLRMAIGARPQDVLLLIMRRGAMITGIGIVIGLAAAFGTTRFISSFLYGISPTDPLTFIDVTLILAAVALAAVFVPARRATSIDPMTALRYE
jgi:putative ABC transport system permease protein